MGGHRCTAAGEHLPHRSQAVSGLLLLHQAGSNVSNILSITHGHGLHPEEEEEEEEVTLAGLAVHVTTAEKQPGSPKQHWSERQGWGCRTQHCPVHTPGRPGVPKAAPPAAQPGVGHRRETRPTSPAPPSGTTRSEERRDETCKSCGSKSNGTCLDEEGLGAGRTASSQFGVVRRASRRWGTTTLTQCSTRARHCFSRPYRALRTAPVTYVPQRVSCCYV